jgi:hypothetical protein
MQLVQGWRKFRALDADRRWLIVEATALVGVIWLSLRIVSFAKLRRALDACSNRVLPGSSTPLAAIGWAVSAGGHRFPAKRTCLVEALAADVMLRRRHYKPALHLGVRKTDDRLRPLDGHAWVECDGVIIVGHLDNLADYTAGAWAAAPSCPDND